MLLWRNKVYLCGHPSYLSYDITTVMTQTGMCTHRLVRYTDWSIVSLFMCSIIKAMVLTLSDRKSLAVKSVAKRSFNNPILEDS